jgi:putative Mg2+ transporter-C (MgtC) family protein
MEMLWQELTFGLGSGRQFAQVLLRLIVAALLGGLVGIQRQRARKPAGLRTHILVCLGSSVVVVACSGVGMNFDGQSRVIQGVLTGVGFIGAGSILKLSQEHDIKGLTTAAGVWMTAAMGIACGVGTIGIALIAAVLTVIVLTLVKAIEDRADKKNQE